MKDTQTCCHVTCSSEESTPCYFPVSWDCLIFLPSLKWVQKYPLLLFEQWRWSSAPAKSSVQKRWGSLSGWLAVGNSIALQHHNPTGQLTPVPAAPRHCGVKDFPVSLLQKLLRCDTEWEMLRNSQGSSKPHHNYFTRLCGKKRCHLSISAGYVFLRKAVSV